mmetsp:Transcript_17565/g.25638  ORF Transcript_17565/g.25638 Transcript_17565/m.25638 type:complete len:137 (-) Transcript_17565:254-664(-)
MIIYSIRSRSLTRDMVVVVFDDVNQLEVFLCSRFMLFSAISIGLRHHKCGGFCYLVFDDVFPYSTLYMQCDHNKKRSPDRWEREAPARLLQSSCHIYSSPCYRCVMIAIKDNTEQQTSSFSRDTKEHIYKTNTGGL